MEVMLIVGLFASSALSLNFIVNQKYKLAGSMNIINLCLVVATAYQFDQVKNIVWLFGIAAGVVLVYFVVRFLLKKKKKENKYGMLIFSKLLSLVLSISLIIVSVMAFKGNSFLSNICKHE